MIPSRRVTMLGAATPPSFDAEALDLRFPPELPKSNNEKTVDDAFTKVMTSGDAASSTTERQGLVFTGCQVARTYVSWITTVG
jgi:hypothetical protein